jgi:hypothetical protein
MKRVITKSAWGPTKAHGAISKGPGEQFEISDEDYEEVKDLCTLLDDVPEKKKIKKSEA